jgi:hypothetical protein
LATILALVPPAYAFEPHPDVFERPPHVSERLPRALAALSPADFLGQVRVVENPAAGIVVLSTREGYTRGRVIQGLHVDDVHLRAVVDRASGRVAWQVWHDLITVSRHQDVVAVSYMSGGALRSTSPIAVERSLGQCPPTDGAGFCNRITRIGFELPEDAVRELAASYEARSRTPWRVYFRDGSGTVVTSGLAPAEAAGLISALDAWRRGAPRDSAGDPAG